MKQWFKKLSKMFDSPFADDPPLPGLGGVSESEASMLRRECAARHHQGNAHIEDIARDTFTTLGNGLKSMEERVNELFDLFNDLSAKVESGLSTVIKRATVGGSDQAALFLEMERRISYLETQLSAAIGGASFAEWLKATRETLVDNAKCILALQEAIKPVKDTTTIVASMVDKPAKAPRKHRPF